MRIIFLILVMIILPFSVQAETKKVLECLWLLDPPVIETFIQGDQHSVGRNIFSGWVVDYIYTNNNGMYTVTVKGPNGEERVIGFGPGWPCRYEVTSGIGEQEG